VIVMSSPRGRAPAHGSCDPKTRVTKSKVLTRAEVYDTFFKGAAAVPSVPTLAAVEVAAAEIKGDEAPKKEALKKEAPKKKAPKKKNAAVGQSDRLGSPGPRSQIKKFRPLGD